jgi:ATP-dependent Lon protease
VKRAFVLEREVANLCRKAIKEILMKGKGNFVTPRNLEKYAGVRKFRYGEIDEQDNIGVVNGLAYTEVGGDPAVHRSGRPCR